MTKTWITKHMLKSVLYHSKEAQKALQEDVKDGEKPVNLSKDEIKAIETSLAK